MLEESSNITGLSGATLVPDDATLFLTIYNLNYNATILYDVDFEHTVYKLNGEWVWRPILEVA